MKTPQILSQLSALILCSCTYDNYLAQSSPTGNTVKQTIVQVGGTLSNSRSDGSSGAVNNENTARDVINGVVTYGVAKNARLSHQSDNTLDGVKHVSDNKLKETTVKANATPVPAQIVPEGTVAIPQGFPPHQ